MAVFFFGIQFIYPFSERKKTSKFSIVPNFSATKNQGFPNFKIVSKIQNNFIVWHLWKVDLHPPFHVAENPGGKVCENLMKLHTSPALRKKAKNVPKVLSRSQRNKSKFSFSNHTSHSLPSEEKFCLCTFPEKDQILTSASIPSLID